MEESAVRARDDEDVPAAWRAHALVACVPIAWVIFHLWEQWAAFAGRDAWVARMSTTSIGGGAILGEVLGGVLPIVLWIVLELRLRRREPIALRFAMAEDPALAQRLGLVTRAASWLFAMWALYHAGWLWAPKLVGDVEPLRTWVVLRNELGTWPHAVAHAIGLTALAVHVWAAIPRAAIAQGLADRPESRRAARVSGLILALGIVVLGAQLAGWHAAGRGTVWSMEAGEEP